MADISPHDWLRPKLAALVKDAEAAGIARDVSVAVITDLMNGPLADTAPLQTHEGWNKDIGEPDEFVNVNAPLSAEPTLGDPVPNPLNNIGRHQRF